MKAPAMAILAIAVAAFVPPFHSSEIQEALLESEAELAGECKVVFVDGEADHCVIVIPGTDTPVPLPARR
jgi:hypothetical protein